MQHPGNNISIKSGKGQQRINEMSLGKEQEGFNIYNNHLNNHTTQDSTAVNNSSDHIHDKDNDGAAENNHRLLRDDEKCIESDTNQ